MNLEDKLKQFTGTTQWYRHLTGFLYTDGIKFLAEEANAYWLIDAICANQLVPEVRQEIIQFWTLEVEENNRAILRCDRDSDEPVYSQEIPFTDFPLNSVRIWVGNGILLLPSEY